MILFALLVAWSVLATWPLTSNMATYVAGDLGDPMEYAWLIGWGGHAITAQPLALFDSNMYFPLRNTLVFSENLLGLAIPLAPLTRITGNAVLATNVGILLSIAVASYGVRRLVLTLGGRPLPALLAGLAFAVAPYRIASISHVHVLAIHFLPFALIAFVRLVRAPSPARVAVLSVVLAAQFWTSMTGGTMALLAVAVAGVWWLVARRRDAVVPVGLAATACVGALVLSAPLLVAYKAVVDDHPEYAHPEIEVVENSATPGAYLFPDRGGALVHGLYDTWRDDVEPAKSSHEKTLFPGLSLTVAMVGAAAAAAWRLKVRRAAPAGATLTEGPRPVPMPLLLVALLGVLGFVLSLGPKWGAKEGGFPLPFAALDAVGGGLSRVPARFGVIVTFAVAVGVGLAMSRFRGRLLHVVAASVAIALVVEGWPAAISPSRVPAITAAHRSLANTDRTVLVLPTTEWTPDGNLVAIWPVVREAQILWLTTGHFRPVVNGYGAFIPKAYSDVTKGVQDFPSPSSMALLHRLGIDTVVVENTLTPATPWADVSARLAGWPGARLLTEADGTQVWDVTQG